MAHIHTTRQELLSKGVLLQDYLVCELQNAEGKLRLIDGRLYKLFEVYFAYQKQPIMEFFHNHTYAFWPHIFDLYYETYMVLSSFLFTVWISMKIISLYMRY